MEEFIQIKNKKFVLQSVRAEHPDHTTYIATWSGRIYCLRTYKTDYDKALADYKELKHAGINMAKICFHDDEQHVIVFDYFPEEDCLTVLSKGPLTEPYFDALFSLYRFARFSKVALDWEPQNSCSAGLRCLSPDQMGRLTDENKFENKGLRTWFLGKEGRALLARKGFDISNLPNLEDAAVNKAMALMAVKYW